MVEEVKFCAMLITAMCARRLCELNALQQTVNACLTPTVQGAWKRGQPLAVHAVIYDPATGHLKVRPCELLFPF